MGEFSWVALAAGVAGGLCLGLLGYVDAAKNEQQIFDKKLFFYSMVPALIAGVIAGFSFGDNLVEAFLAGVSGKAIMEKAKGVS